VLRVVGCALIQEARRRLPQSPLRMSYSVVLHLVHYVRFPWSECQAGEQARVRSPWC
jgi:hypothetical protein